VTLEVQQCSVCNRHTTNALDDDDDDNGDDDDILLSVFTVTLRTGNGSKVSPTWWLGGAWSWKILTQ